MEEVVGFLFNLEVNVTPAAPAVGVVADETGAPVDVAAQLQAKGLERQAPRRAVLSGPDEGGRAAAMPDAVEDALDDAADAAKVARTRPVPPPAHKARQQAPKKRKRR